jgi:hypothetical protein
MTEFYGADGVFTYEGRIPAAKVEDALVELAAKIKSNPAASLVDSVRSVVLEHAMNGIWVVCDIVSQLMELRHA